MCWTCKGIPELKIAQEDIPVFKIITNVEEDFYSYFRNYKYYKNTGYCYKLYVNKTETFDTKGKLITATYSIDVGLHSYSPECEVREDRSIFGELIGVRVMSSNKLLQDYPLKYGRLVKMNCIIPKGSEYFVNENGEYVSNRIQILEGKCVG